MQLNSTTHEVYWNDVTLTLSAKEFALLELFVRNPSRTYSQSAILNQLWSIEAEIPSEETVRAHIKRLRQKLKTIGLIDAIETVYGVGYRLNRQFYQPESESAIAPPPPFTQRLLLIEEAAQSLLLDSLSAEAHHQALKECRKLVNAFTLLKQATGQNLAEQLEKVFQVKKSLSTVQRQTLRETIVQLKRLIDSTQPSALRAQARTSESYPRVLIVNYQCDRLESLLSEAIQHPLEVIIETSINAAFQTIQRLSPDLVILDLCDPHHYTNGLKFLKTFGASVPIIVLVEPDVNRLQLAQAQGRDLLPASISCADLFSAIEQFLKPIASEATILVLDDDELTLQLLKRLLEPWGLKAELLNDPLKIWQQLETITPDLLILDLNMPGMNGIELCQHLRNHPNWDWLPILVLTTERDATTIQQVFTAGADDYVSKPVVPPELITRLFNRLERARLLRRQTEIDSLTGLMNYTRSHQLLTQQVKLAYQREQPFTLAVLEIQHWSSLCRRLGHSASATILRQIAQHLRQSFRATDVIGRWMEAEFVIGWAGLKSEDGMQWIESTIEQFQTDESIEFTIGVSRIRHCELTDLYADATQVVKTRSI